MPAQALTLASLRAHDPHGGRGSSCNQRWKCPLCGSSERALSVNELEGVYRCWRGSCGAHGRLGDAARFDAREMEQRRREAESLEAGRKRRLWASVRLHGLRGTEGVKYLEGRGIDAGTAARAGVAWCEWFLGHPAVVFRIRDVSGRVVALQGRYLHTDDQGDKCRSIGDISRGVFCTAGAWDGDIVLCEAPIDALSLACMGCPAMATCGTRLPDWMPQATVGRVVRIATDADEAGDEAAWKWAVLLRPYAAQVRRTRPTRGKDWNEEWRSRP